MACLSYQLPLEFVIRQGQLVEAGTQARNTTYPGQIHTSFVAVGTLPTANEARQEIAAALRQYFKVMEPA